MSNMLAGIRFFPVPTHLIRSTIIKRLSPGALTLYLGILYKSQHHSTTFISLSNDAAEELLGLAPTTLRKARIELWEAGLIDYYKRPGREYVYVLIDPDAHRVLPSKGAEKLTDEFLRLRPGRCSASTPTPLVEGLHWNDLQ